MYPPLAELAVNGGAIAMPLAFVRTRNVRTEPVRPWTRAVKLPPGPWTGAKKRTGIPATGLPSTSVTVTARRTGKREPTAVEIPSAAPVAIVAGLPARFRSTNAIGLPPATEAVASKLPATVFAVRGGAVAMPELFVATTAWLSPPAKLAPGSAAP